MERFKYVLIIWATIGLVACKKQEIVDPEILVEHVFVEAVKSNRIDLNYKLSSLGYETTGVIYYKKTNATESREISAIRVNGRLQIALQQLEANTDYVFKVFFKQNGEKKTDSKDYTVKTLAKEAESFALQVKNTSIYYDDNGNFTADIEGNNLNNLNLSELELKVAFTKVVFGYPILISGNRYRITIKGLVNPVNTENQITAVYQGKQILLQTIPFVFDGDRYWMTYNPTNLPGYNASVFGNEIYYAFDRKILKWIDVEQKLTTVGDIPNATIPHGSVGFAFDGLLFFSVTEQYVRSDANNFYNQPAAFIYNPISGQWTSFSFSNLLITNRSRVIKNANYFVHKNELYLTYSLQDDNALPGSIIKTDNFIFRYHKETRRFETAADFKSEILNYNFLSINQQMYLCGLVPVYDQGFKISATLAIYKVTDNFVLEEIFRAGTTAEPLSALPRYVTVYDQKLLIGYSLHDFLIFDPVTNQLNEVYLKNQIGNQYFSGFFTYNNKLHINADLFFTSQKIYEISIHKGR